LAFILWVTALQRTTPTRVASTMTVNPIAAALLASPLVGEPITPNLIVGLLAVFAGIWLATTEKRNAGRASPMETSTKSKRGDSRLEAPWRKPEPGGQMPGK
jgi:hypothetical protein